MADVVIPRQTDRQVTVEGYVLDPVPAHVKRFEDKEIKCNGKECGRLFTGSFDEIHREIRCPHCNRMTQIPMQYWGNP